MTTNNIPAHRPSYIAVAETRIRSAADKVIAQYNKGLLTFDDFMNQLHTIDDARIYEEEAAAEEARDAWEDRRAEALGLD